MDTPSSKFVVVTGGAGFLGFHVVSRLNDDGHRVFVPRQADFDLRDSHETERMLTSAFGGPPPDIVIHCAARSGGLGDIKANPDAFRDDNTALGLNIVDACVRSGMPDLGGRLVMIGNMVQYPIDAPMPLKEDSLGTGTLDPVTAPYADAKNAGFDALRRAHNERRLRGGFLIPCNLYGPGDNAAHFVGATIARVLEAVRTDAESITCWGTGTPTRDFLFVEDAADAIVRAAMTIDNPEPINLSPGIEMSIKEAVGIIADVAGFAGRIGWDTTKPEGVPRRCLDPTRARERLGWSAATRFDEGVVGTIASIRSENR